MHQHDLNLEEMIHFTHRIKNVFYFEHFFLNKNKTSEISTLFTSCRRFDDWHFPIINLDDVSYCWNFILERFALFSEPRSRLLDLNINENWHTPMVNILECSRRLYEIQKYIHYELYYDELELLRLNGSAWPLGIDTFWILKLWLALANRKRK